MWQISCSRLGEGGEIWGVVEDEILMQRVLNSPNDCSYIFPTLPFTTQKKIKRPPPLIIMFNCFDGVVASRSLPGAIPCRPVHYNSGIPMVSPGYIAPPQSNEK